MRRAILALVTLGAVAVPVTAIAPAANADAGSPTCVTRAEYRQVNKGMTKAAVDREFGIHGKRQAGATSGGYRSEVWSYRTCQRYSALAVSFSANPGGPLRLAAKSAVWAY